MLSSQLPNAVGIAGNPPAKPAKEANMPVKQMGSLQIIILSPFLHI